MSRRERITIATLRARKRERQPITVLTCYDYSTAKIMDEVGIDSLLVGDTYGEVCLGHSSTLPVTVDHLVTVTAAVRRGAPHVFLIGDMPYLSYQVSPEDAIRNAGKFMAGAGCDCVKVEVDRRLSDTVAALSRATIPVMAHLGLRPQSLHQWGSYKAQGTTADAALTLVEDAKIMQDNGAVALLLEAVPFQVAELITQNTDLPVIGCVAGPHCDGQVVVMHDMLAYGGGHPPRSVKVYANLHETLSAAFRGYCDDVRAREFPNQSNSISIPDAEWTKLHRALDRRP